MSISLARDDTSSIVLTWAPEGRRKRGKTKDNVEEYHRNRKKLAGWQTGNEARAAAANNETWKRSVAALIMYHKKQTDELSLSLGEALTDGIGGKVFDLGKFQNPKTSLI